MFYIEKDNKILLCDENKQNLQNTKMFMHELANVQILETDKHIIDRHGELIFAEDIEQELVEETRNYLIENINYPLKEKVAYTGVMFEKDGQELCFETNKQSMSLINFTLTQILAGNMDNIRNWKCRKTTAPFQPVAVDFTKEQFQKLVAFAGNLVSIAFTLEAHFNERIEQLTTDQLKDDIFIKSLKEQMQNDYDAIDIKLHDLFPTNIPIIE